MNVEELRNYLGVDTLEFLSMDNLKVILGSSNHCFGCFTEEYPVPPGPNPDFKDE
jgi:amidophosphoribosyltransferase